MKVLGVMSGTSLDGLDLALVEFLERADESGLDFNILATETIEYSDTWIQALRNSVFASGKELTQLDVNYGRFIGDQCRLFLRKHDESCDLIASHGHTVFHEPEKGYTLQIGSGTYIVEETGISTIYDFRSADLAQGGHGAPLVPLGDLLLFPEYDCCVNLGGIANISLMKSKSEGIGFDVCPFNILLNHYSQKLGFVYDKGGENARKGHSSTQLLEALNLLPYYRALPPKSLDKENLLKTYLPLIDQFNLSAEDVLSSLCDHFGHQINTVLEGSRNVLLTGGGAFNTFFIEVLESRFPRTLHRPSKQLIEFKEAVIFALLGYLRFQGEDNILKVITGGRKNLSSGILIEA